MLYTQRHYYIATQLSVLAILLAMLYGYRNIQIDDSYIFYSYAQNIANGNGYVFNPDERINATTSIFAALSVEFIFTYLKRQSKNKDWTGPHNNYFNSSFNRD